MIDRDIVVAKLAISINRGTLASSVFETAWSSYFQDIVGQIDLLNVMFCSYRNLYAQCVTDSERRRIADQILSDYQIIKSKINYSIINDELFQLIFTFGNCQDFLSVQFRELCVAFYEQLKKIKVEQIAQYLYKKIINIIVHCNLYTQEPFQSILEESTLTLEHLTCVGVHPGQVRFLE